MNKITPIRSFFPNNLGIGQADALNSKQKKN